MGAALVAAGAAGFSAAGAGGVGLLQALNAEASSKRDAKIRWEIIIWGLVCEGLRRRESGCSYCGIISKRLRLLNLTNRYFRPDGR